MKSPQIIHGLIGFSIIFTIHFGGNTPIYGNTQIEQHILVGKPMVVGYHHFRKPPHSLQLQVLGPSELPRQGFFHMLHRGAAGHRHHHRVAVRGMRHGHLGRQGEGRGRSNPSQTGGGFGFISPGFFHMQIPKKMKLATNWWKTQEFLQCFPQIKNLAFKVIATRKKERNCLNSPRILPSNLGL